MTPNPIVFTLGDFDPSGSGKGGIKENVGNDMLKLGMDIKPIDLAVTIEQIRSFKLPHKPDDPEEIQKLKDDPRFKNWEYGVFRVETASLRVRQPDYFDNLLRSAVLKCFDQKTYERLESPLRRDRNRIKKLVESVLIGEALP